MAEIVGVKFREDGRVYSFDSKGIKFKVGDYAVVDTARGMECGMVAKENTIVGEEELVKPLKSVIRAATDEDIINAVSASGYSAVRHGSKSAINDNKNLQNAFSYRIGIMYTLVAIIGVVRWILF